jgi:hypothetical protein
MNIHLIRTEGFPEDQFHELLAFLRKQVGILQFVGGKTVTLNPDYTYHIFIEEKEYETQFKPRKQIDSHFMASESSSDSFYEKPTFPLRKRIYTWENLLNAARAYRQFNQVPDNDLIFLLTDAHNTKNWFGGIDENMKNFFVHTADWPLFFRLLNKPIYPIAYEILAWVLRSLMFKSREEIIDFVHDEPVGCINDFCSEKKQIILKMRTGDICDECMDQIIYNDVSPPLLRQIQGILNEIRQHILFSRNRNVYLTSSRLLIDLSTRKLYFPDYAQGEAKLNPKELALYLLFLEQTNGIALNQVIDFKAELLEKYKQISGQIKPEKMQATIDLLCDYRENELNITLSRIRKKIKDVIGKEFAKKYTIDLLANNQHGILIDREFVEISA